MGEISGANASDLEDDSLYRLKEICLVEPYCEETPFEEFCDDIVMVSDTPSIGHTDLMCTKPLDLNPTSSPLLPTNPSHLHAFHKSLGDIRGSHPTFDPYCTYMEDVPRQIMWSIFFDHAFDFSMAFGKFKKPLTFLASSSVVFSYLHNFEMNNITYDKILRALTAFKSRTQLLSYIEEWLVLFEPLISPF